MKKIVNILFVFTLIVITGCNHTKWLSQNCDLALGVCYTADTIPNDKDVSSSVQTDTAYIIDTVYSGIRFVIECDSSDFMPKIKELEQINDGLNDQLIVKDNQIKYYVSKGQIIRERRIVTNDTITKYVKVPVENPLNEQCREDVIKLGQKVSTMWKWIIGLGIGIVLLIVTIYLIWKLKR